MSQTLRCSKQKLKLQPSSRSKQNVTVHLSSHILLPSQKARLPSSGRFFTSSPSSRSLCYQSHLAKARPVSHRSLSTLSSSHIHNLSLTARRNEGISSINASTSGFRTRFLSSAISRQQAKGNGEKASTDIDVSRSRETSKPVPTILTKLNPLTIKERKENIYTLPNILTFSRLIAAPAIGYAILTSHPHLALGLFAYAGVTDLVDGYLARRFNSQTVVGTILDPMADKTLMTIVVVCLTIQGVLPIWLAVIVLGRDVALAISAIYFRWISLPPPKTFSRYWDFSLPSAEVHPTEISKINTFLQLLLIGNAMILPTLPTALADAWNLYGVFEGWQVLVASTTIWSGLSYVFNKDAVKILSKEEVEEKQREQAEKQQS